MSLELRALFSLTDGLERLEGRQRLCLSRWGGFGIGVGLLGRRAVLTGDGWGQGADGGARAGRFLPRYR